MLGWAMIGAVWLAPGCSNGGANGAVDNQPVPISIDLTNAFIAALSIEGYERRGSDQTNPIYSPLRLGKPLDEIDTVFDYDFPRLFATQAALAGVDRRSVMKEMFVQVCAGCQNDTERHLEVMEFCNKASNHNLIQPMWPDGTGMYDPLLCFELGEARCGHVARMAIAMFDAAGYPGRLVQMGFHVSCEVFYDDDWHYLEADLFGGRWSVFDEDGTIPSFDELSRDPFAIDAMPANFEPTWQNPLMGSGIYTSWFYFSSDSYTSPAQSYVKASTAEEAQQSRNYGWERIYVEPNPNRQLRSFEPRFYPGSPLDLRVEDGRVVWRDATDLDGDLLGYRVYFGSRSRGWYYGSSWQPEMYDARFKLPPHDLGVVETAKTSVAMPSARPLYVTVMAFDAHGEAVGRTLYPMSNELEIGADELASASSASLTGK